MHLRVKYPQIQQQKQPVLSPGKTLRGQWETTTKVKNLNGYDWNITTMKRSNGVVTSSSQACKLSNSDNASIITFAVFSDPSVQLVQQQASRVTQKVIKETHAETLHKFDEIYAAGELPVNKTATDKPQIGQIVCNQDMQHRAAIYEIGESSFGIYAKYINLKTKVFGQTDRLRSINDKFGIGTYYIPGETISEDEVSNLLIEAKEIKVKQDQAHEAAKRAEEIQRLANIEKGKDLVNIPKDACAIIVAHFKNDTSDPYSDYFAHKTAKTVYLAYSFTKRNNFSEMRKAAARFTDTAHLKDAPASFEQRHNYSMGSGYWFGESHHSGWEIRKGYLNADDPATLEKLQIAAAEGRYFCENLKSSNKEDESIESYENFTLSKTKHTKKGHDLYVASVIDRVDRQTFLQYKAIAKEYDGYYSSYNRDGAIPGFQFTSEEEAKEFILQANTVEI